VAKRFDGTMEKIREGAKKRSESTKEFSAA
jgi:hypothetical protein